MAKASVFEPTADEPIDYKTAISECIAAVARVRQQMADNQVDIDRLKAESQVILARLNAL